VAELGQDVDLETMRLEALQRLELGLGHGLGMGAPGIGEEAQVALAGDARIKLAQ